MPEKDSATERGQLSLQDFYVSVRNLTEILAAPLSPEDQTIQSMPDVSPTKWHRAHTTWFFETFVLEPFANQKPLIPEYKYLFNSYYEQVGKQFPRPQRGLLSRPSCEEVSNYRSAIDEAMLGLISSGDLSPQLEETIILGLNHEQQHQELLLMDIKHVLSINPLQPIYQAREHQSISGQKQSWVDFKGGLVDIGAEGTGFRFDNEGPQHQVYLEDFQLSSRLVSCGDYLEFIEDGGYQRPELWLSAGWHTLKAENWKAPLYWCKNEDSWWVHTLSGTRPIDPEEPACHLSFYEAEAFAQWAQARLPTEFEWEYAAKTQPLQGNFLQHNYLHPRATAARPLSDIYGEVWQWTGSAYRPYPRYRAPEGAIGEYNGKFMSGQQVLRGGCAFTPAGHVRPTYRNFFPPHSRWMLSGLRLARDL